MSRVIVISPSGNLYGSEQVLLDYLINTQKQLDVAVPAFSLLAKSLESLNSNHHIVLFDSKHINKFYIWLFKQLLSNKYDVVYLNEAGHTKYINVLARIFRWKKFVVHVRIIEDTNVARWKYFSSMNTKLISISKNISEQLPITNTLLYDLYMFSKEKENMHTQVKGETIKVGIIGRIAYSKGARELEKLVDYIAARNDTNRYRIFLFGDIAPEMESDPLIEKLKQLPFVEFKGFVSNKHDIYENIDVVLHMSKTEPLGRIFLESIDAEKPFIGFNSAGIGEIGELTYLHDLLCDPKSEDYPTHIFDKLEEVRNNYDLHLVKIKSKKQLAKDVFSVQNYTSVLDNILKK